MNPTPKQPLFYLPSHHLKPEKKKMWNLDTGREIHTLTCSASPVCRLAISPGQMLVGVDLDQTIWFWEI